MTAISLPPTYQLFVGIDIAAASFAASWTNAGPPASAQTFGQTPDGFAAFQRWLATTNFAPAATLVLVKAIGSYSGQSHQKICRYLW